MADDSLAPRLERFLDARLAGSVRLTSLERSTEGFSAETFAFDAEVTHADGRRELRRWVAKREPVAGLLEPYDLGPEFRVLHALSDDPLPSPPTPWFTTDPADLDRPFYVMERVEGDVPVPAGGDPDGPVPEAVRATLGPDVVDALARLHAIDWRGRGFDFLGVPTPGAAIARTELARWERRIADSGLAVDPPLAEALQWLRANVPSTDDITLVHGDYRLGNFIVRDGRLAGILDWEMVHLGDPLEDVAWCTSPLWRGGGPLASCLMMPEDFVARYAAASGRAAAPERLRFYEVLSIVKMIAIMLTGIRAFRDGRTTDLRMAIFDHQLPFLYLLLGTLRGWIG